MKFSRLPLTLACLTAFCFISYATSDKDRRLSFAYDVDFGMDFDNREFSRSDFSRSMTIFAARVTPSVGLDFRQNPQTVH